MRRRLLVAVVITTGWVSVLAGAAWIQVFVELPARSRIGAVAYARFARASDLGPGQIVYPLLGLGGVLLTAGVFALALRAHAPRRLKAMLGGAAACALVGLLVNIPAVATMQDAGRAPDRAPVLAPLLDRFAALSAARTVFVELTFWVMLAALVIAVAWLGLSPQDSRHDGARDPG